MENMQPFKIEPGASDQRRRDLIESTVAIVLAGTEATFIFQWQQA